MRKEGRKIKEKRGKKRGRLQDREIDKEEEIFQCRKILKQRTDLEEISR